MSNGAATLIDAGIDFLTLTAKTSSSRCPLLMTAAALCDLEYQCGNEWKQWRGLGYEGQQCGSVSYGFGKEGALVRVSSELAHHYFDDLIGDASNCSRLDVQMTYSVSSGCAKHIAKEYARAKAYNANLKRPRKLKYLGTPSGLETINFGSRQSSRYGRIYDKFAESGLDHYQNCVRYEVELKERHAKSIASALVHASDKFATISSEVNHFFSTRGTAPPGGSITTGGRRIGPVGERTCNNREVLTKSALRSRKLGYINECLQPFVLRCTRILTWSEILRALGVPEEVLLDEAWSIEAERKSILKEDDL